MSSVIPFLTRKFKGFDRHGLRGPLLYLPRAFPFVPPPLTRISAVFGSTSFLHDAAGCRSGEGPNALFPFLREGLEAGAGPPQTRPESGFPWLNAPNAVSIRDDGWDGRRYRAPV